MKIESNGNLKRLIVSMLRTGFLGFGGGSALIPILEEEAVDEGVVTEEEFNKDVVVAQITPGALPVEIASMIGQKVGGSLGMVLGALCMALPGAVMTLILVSLIHGSGSLLIRQIGFASAGVTAYIIFMLFDYAKTTVVNSKKNKNAKWAILVVLLVFFFTCGKELIGVLQLDRKPIFDIATTDVLIVAFFVIFYTRGKFTKSNAAISLIISILYILCVGKTPVFPSQLLLVLRIIMLILGIWGLCQSMKGRMRFEFKTVIPVFKKLAIWAVFLLIFSVPALVLIGNVFEFMGKGVLSALLSFGGGDAYLALADGLFVDTGFISEEEFYSNVVVVANAVPGSILCKVLSGMGYVIGHNNGNVLSGISLSLVGFASGVAASGGTVAVVYYIYERFETLDVFKLIKLWIRPIVSGLLLSVCLSMVGQNMKVSFANEWPVAFMLILTAGLFVMNFLLKRRGHMRPIFRVIISAALSFVICNVVAFGGF